jgi:hypothetical protein
LPDGYVAATATIDWRAGRLELKRRRPDLKQLLSMASNLPRAVFRFASMLTTQCFAGNAVEMPGNLPPKSSSRLQLTLE